MSKDNIDFAVAYYTAMGNKDLSGMEGHLHSQVHFLSPMVEMTGKQAVLEAAQKLFNNLNSLEIRAKCAAVDQVILVMDMDCSAPIGILRAASFLSFKDGLIVRIELFFDPRQFVSKKEEIFTSQS